MKEQFIKNAQAQFLRDTIEFYNAGNRCKTEFACMYSPTEFSPGCAIGRHILNEALRADWDHNRVNGQTMDGPGMNAWTPTAEIALGSLAALGFSFLTQCQRLHDTDKNWDAQGLTQKGADEAAGICHLFALDPSKVFPTSGVTSRITPQAQDTATT